MKKKDNLLHLPTGTHLLAEFIDCKVFDFSKNNLEDAAIASKSKPLEYVEHKFKPLGKTGVMLLEESHISIHTYPEHKYIAVDVFTCGDHTKPSNALEVLKKLFIPRKMIVKEIKRGLYH